jgi:type IV pilus assembly protein PilA
MKSMKMMKKAQQGFTLIELMIVVAIIGILAAVAIPQYQDYTMKAKLGNAVTAVDSVKTAVALCAQEAGGDLSVCDSGQNGVPAAADFTPTKEVASMNAIANGVITVTLQSTGLGTPINGKTITFTPSVPANTTTALVWTVSTNISQTNLADQLTKNNPASGGGSGS